MEDCVRTHDYRYGVKRSYLIKECMKCGFGITVRDFSTDELKACYERNYNYSAVPRKRITSLRALVGRFFRRGENALLRHAQGRVLDFGSGQGGMLQQLEKRGCQAVGTDFSNEACDNLTRAGFKICTLLELESETHNGTFDAVLLSQVFEHLDRPDDFLKTFYRLVKPGGKIILAVPNFGSIYRKIFGPYWGGYHVPYHLFHYTKNSLTLLLRQHGFVCIKVWYSTPFHFPLVSLISYLRRNKMDGTSIETHLLFRNLILKVTMALLVIIGDMFVPASQKDCLFLTAVKLPD